MKMWAYYWWFLGSKTWILGLDFLRPSVSMDYTVHWLFVKALSELFEGFPNLMIAIKGYLNWMKIIRIPSRLYNHILIVKNYTLILKLLSAIQLCVLKWLKNEKSTEFS